MRVGKPVREIEDVPRPVRTEPIRVPERVPVPVRRVPARVPDKKAWGRIGMTIEEIPYSCPYCGSEMTIEDGILYCPEHGVIYYG